MEKLSKMWKYDLEIDTTNTNSFANARKILRELEGNVVIHAENSNYAALLPEFLQKFITKLSKEELKTKGSNYVESKLLNKFHRLTFEEKASRGKELSVLVEVDAQTIAIANNEKKYKEKRTEYSLLINKEIEKGNLIEGMGLNSHYEKQENYLRKKNEKLKLSSNKFLSLGNNLPFRLMIAFPLLIVSILTGLNLVLFWSIVLQNYNETFEARKINRLSGKNGREINIAYCSHDNLIEGASTGQKQLANINNTLKNKKNAAIFLFDEADNALDSEKQTELDYTKKIKLKVNDLNFSYGERIIFCDLQLQAFSGDKIIIVGENVKSEGNIGYLPQSFENFSRCSAWEYLINETGGFRLMRIISQLQLAPSILERKFSTLSGGEKTKFHLAALRFQNPDILLLDEPTNHLDEIGLN
ncbi:19983_t:CDS:2 [Funneliformis geosporum]|uniref:19983_t:CDS:1 n=1 Tax=Funneliformis geosporum TaxID=1117311 RepID=A0A9W4WSU1_9GLOM|nr:19983_t:CDS:2 [Funneliformis geosporum]